MNGFLAMSTLTAARMQMTLSLAFHILFAAVGIGLPLLMVLAEHRYLRTGGAHWLRLTTQWAKATGLLFAVGAVSGTALSFEMGLLWPRYTEIMGAAVGHLFALEGFAFFIEAIFIGLYLYGREKLSPWAHWWCGVVIAASGALSGVLVVGVNAWMQLPVGFRMDDAGRVVGTEPMAIFKTYAWWTMALHSTLASYIALSFAAAAVYAAGYLRGRRDAYHRAAIAMCITVGGSCALLQMISGDLIAKFVHDTQPAKFAAMEAHFETSAYAPAVIGGIPNLAEGRIDYGIKIPGLLSFLATHKPSSVVKGLNDIPRDLWPNVTLVHIAFDTMVGSGTLLAVLSIVFGIVAWKRRSPLAPSPGTPGEGWGGGSAISQRGSPPPLPSPGVPGEGTSAVRPSSPTVFDSRWLLRAIAFFGGLGMIALEAGWIVTEAGRQPWVINGVLRTSAAATNSPHAVPMFWAYVALYAALAVATVWLLRFVGRSTRGGDHAGD